MTATRTSAVRLWLARCALLIGSICLGFVVAEVGLRLAGHGGVDTIAHARFDPLYGTVRADSWIFDFSIAPGDRTVQIREQVIPVRKRPGERRVLFIGDSATVGAFLPITQSYPLVFKSLLDEARPGNLVSVINAGVWGMTTIDELHLLRDKLLGLSPDEVVLGLFMANDINFNLAHVERRARDGSPGWLSWLRARSALGQALFVRALAFNARHRWVDTSLGQTRWAPVELGLIDRRGLHMLSYPAGELATYIRPPSALVDHAFEVLATVLGQLKALGERHGFGLRVLLIPSPSRVAGSLRILAHPDILRELSAQGVSVDATSLDFGQPTRRVLRICRELELPCIDPTARLRRRGNAVFFPGDEHPTRIGHLALAQELLAH